MNLDLIVKLATIGIFICTIIATIWAVKVSRQTIKTVERESRPWVAPLRINTVLHADIMTMKVEIQNVGKLPAFVDLDCSMKFDDQTHKPDSQSGTAVMVPNQLVRTSFAMKDSSYKKLLSSQTQLFIHILIKYTDEKDKPEKYYTRVEWEFNPTLIPSSWDHVTPLEMVAIWTVKSADMR